MPVDWRSWCEGLGVLHDDGVLIKLAQGRAHFVFVIDHLEAEMLELSGLVVERGEGVAALEELLLNRERRMSGVVVDHAGNAWVTALLPLLGLGLEEFRFFALEVAAEADRLEFLATGKDHF